MAESGNCKHCSNPNHQELMSHLRSEQINDHPTRCRIINALAMHERVGVCCLADLVGMTVSSVSHQLSILKLQRLVKSEKEGRNVFYSLSDRHVHDVFVTALEHVKE